MIETAEHQDCNKDTSDHCDFPLYSPSSIITSSSDTSPSSSFFPTPSSRHLAKVMMAHQTNQTNFLAKNGCCVPDAIRPVSSDGAGEPTADVGLPPSASENPVEDAAASSSFEEHGILRQRLKNAVVQSDNSATADPQSASTQADAANNNTDEDNLYDEWDTLVIDGAAHAGGITKIRFNLMEEVLILGIKDKEGYTSFWNDNISPGLRGAILVELAMQKRIRLDKVKTRRRSLIYRKVICVDNSSTGDALLDEALKHVKENSGIYSVASWIDLLSGDTWNPINFRFHMRNLRGRLAKTLADKGICGTQKQNFLIFDMTTHPIANSTLKTMLVDRVQSLLLTSWRSDLTRFRSKRSLALLYLAQASDVLDNALASLNYMDFDLASKHLRDLLAVDPEAESQKHDQAMEVMWAVVATFLK